MPEAAPALAAARRADAWSTVAVVVASLLVIAVPLAVVRYPPMTDLPFHAAQSATFGHYSDPSYHLREQFELRPFAVPYASMYVLAAALMAVMPAVAAVKIAAAAMLAALPAGLWLLLQGMKKSPLPAAFGLLAVWGPLTQLGFLNFVGAVGLFAAAVGLALDVASRSTFLRKVSLSVVLALVFFTHVFRFPFAVAGVVGAGLFVGIATRRLKACALALAPTLVVPVALFAAWVVVRPRTIQASLGPLSLHLERFRELGCLTGSFRDPAERTALWLAGLALGLYAFVTLAARRFEHEASASSRGSGAVRFRRAAALVALCCALASLLLYLVLPLNIGGWYYVYPREATVFAFLAFALLPDLPRAFAPRVLAVSLAIAAPLPGALVVGRNYAGFDEQTRDFDAMVALLPQAPRLAYLIFDHTGATRTVSPFTHLPAWVQAEKGGWLSFHFEHFGNAPVYYRPRVPGDRDVPPPTPDAWEWRPDAFDIEDERGRFFDWFLVRAKDSPERVFAPDPIVVQVSHAGRWWLYRRTPRQSASP